MSKSPEQLKLEYPQLKADIDLCYKQLHELCQGKHDKARMCIPHQTTDFDMQFSAAFDELLAYRKTEEEGRLHVAPIKNGETVYTIQQEATDNADLIVMEVDYSYGFTETWLAGNWFPTLPEAEAALAKMKNEEILK